MNSDSRPLVTVIVPVFNGERYLDRALASVEAQTYPALDVIVVDDGSTDGSEVVARRHMAFRYLRRANGGPSAARNTGVAEAFGEYLAFLDHDDWWEPEKLARQVEFLQANPELGYALCLQTYDLAPGEAAPRWFRPRDIAVPEVSYVPSAWLVRKNAWETVGPFAGQYRHAQDIDWIARAKDLGVTAGVVMELLLHKGVHTDNLSSGPTQRELLAALRASTHRMRHA